MAARLASLETRLTMLESQGGGHESGRAEGLLIAFAARRALDKGMALGYVEGELTRQFGASQPRAVSMIVAAARQPVTIEGLKAGIETIGTQIAHPSEDASWWEGLRQGLANLIIVREAGTLSPDPAARVARARDLVAGGRVDQALAEVARLPNASLTEHWIADARRYVEAQRALDLLEAAAIMPKEQGAVTVPPAEHAAPAKPAPGETF
jgi:hypothetical protein